MTLQQALKVSDLVVCNRHPNLVYFLRGGYLYCRSLSTECKSGMLLDEILTTEWSPYVEPKQPCKHEPLTEVTTLGFIFHDQCKHCRKSLKALGWVEV